MWIARIGPDHQTGFTLAPLYDHVFQLLTPDILTGVEDVKTVRYHRHQTLWKFVQHVGERFLLVILTPSRNRTEKM